MQEEQYDSPFIKRNVERRASEVPEESQVQTATLFFLLLLQLLSFVILILPLLSFICSFLSSPTPAPGALRDLPGRARRLCRRRSSQLLHEVRQEVAGRC